MSHVYKLFAEDWKDYCDFSEEPALKGKSRDVAKSLLVSPSGGTSLDISGLERELEDGALVLSISDGEFSIGDNLKERFEKKLESCDYAHMQIGSKSSFSSYLEGLGIPVINVKGDDDLANAMVSFVSGYYKRIKGAGK